MTTFTKEELKMIMDALLVYDHEIRSDTAVALAQRINEEEQFEWVDECFRPLDRDQKTT